MSKKANKKYVPWQELWIDACPNCGEKLMKDMFDGKTLGCSCGFIITDETKKLLEKRDKSNGN